MSDSTTTKSVRRPHTVNLSNDGCGRRKEWVQVGLAPTVVADLLGKDGKGLVLHLPGGRQMTGYRGWRRGTDTEFWGFEVDLPGGYFHECKLEGTPSPQPAPTFRLHRYVADDLEDLQMSVRLWPEVTTDGFGDEEPQPQPSPITVPVRVTHNPSRDTIYSMHWDLSAQIPGTPITVEGHAITYHDQPQVRFQVRVGKSGHNGEYTFDWDKLELMCGEYLYVDNAPALGVSEPYVDANGQHIMQLSGPLETAHAQLLRYDGWILCLPSMPMGGYNDPAIRTAYPSIVEGGHMRAISTEWDGNFSSLKQTPKLPTDWVKPWHHADEAHAHHKVRMATVGSIYDQRPESLPKYSGSTGANCEFSAAQDVLALRLADPRRIAALRWNADSYWLRPIHNREPDGTPMVYDLHPGMSSWGMIPSIRVGATDICGWPETASGYPPSGGGSGYSGIDEQHHVEKLLTCLAHIDPDPGIDVLLADLTFCDLGQAMVKKGWTGNPRAEGRLIGAWADRIGLLPKDLAEDLKAHADKRAKTMFDKRTGKDLPLTQMRPLTIQHKYGMPQWIIDMWEHAIACRGYYAYSLRTKSQDAFIMAEECARLVTQFGTFMQDGIWRCCTHIDWRENGEPWPTSAYVHPSGVMNSSAGDWWTWIGAAVLIAEEMGVQPARARTIIEARGLDEPWTENEAEWWAVKVQI